jgi:hypothetical protein
LTFQLATFSMAEREPRRDEGHEATRNNDR